MLEFQGVMNVAIPQQIAQDELTSCTYEENYCFVSPNMLTTVVRPVHLRKQHLG